jgi:hypothetical protein
MSIKGGFVDEMNVDGKFSLFYVGTKRFAEYQERVIVVYWEY